MSLEVDKLCISTRGALTVGHQAMWVIFEHLVGRHQLFFGQFCLIGARARQQERELRLVI